MGQRDAGMLDDPKPQSLLGPGTLYLLGSRVGLWKGGTKSSKLKEAEDGNWIWRG